MARTTEQAIKCFEDAIGQAAKAANTKSLTELARVLSIMSTGGYLISKAIQDTYNKLEQIDRKLSSASTHRRPTM